MYQQSEVKISDSEWFILQAIWDKSPITIRDIIKALKHTPWARTTIQAMVSRLVTKKIISTSASGYAFLYSPLISKEEAVKMYTKSFIDRVYNGNASVLVATIASGDYLTSQEKKVVKKLL